MIIPNGQAWADTKTARHCLAAAADRMKSMRNVGTLLRRRRQRNRAIGKRAQIGDHVGALSVLRDAGKAHRGARNKALGIGDELVEVVKGPLATPKGFIPGTAMGLAG